MIGFSLILAAEVIVRTFEPLPAEPWKETFTAQCGEMLFEIVRPIYPSGLKPTVTLNGRDMADISGLSEELDERGAAYRMSFLCSQNAHSLTFRWVRGTFEGGGSIAYRSGSVSVDNSGVLDVMSWPATEEDFWYR